MLKRYAHLLGLIHYVKGESTRKKELGDASTAISVNWDIQLKDITIRVIHAGGREEMYRNSIPASLLMQKYPGMCVARPEVFKNPHESLLSADEKLLPGKKYYIIPSTTVQKIKRKHSKKGKVKEGVESDEPNLDLKEVGGDFSDESFRSAKDFYILNEMWSRCAVKDGRKEKKPFVTPIQKSRTSRWEPSLTSIQELSP